MEPKEVKAVEVSPPTVGVISEPWYRNELVRWLVPLVVSLVVGWLANHGVTPAPVPPLPTPAPTPAPMVLVLNLGQPATVSPSPVVPASQPAK